MIFPLNAGRLLLAGGLVSCQCCPPAEETFELAIKYGWEGTGQVDLDTKTVFLSEQVGWSCGFGGTYLAWLEGGSPCVEGSCDDTTLNGFERVDVRVDLARTAALWTSSVNIELFAGWYSPAGGTGPATVTVTYNGVTDSKTITPGTQSGCAATAVATITVYADGTFDLV
jgi:hypothetical protein